MKRSISILLCLAMLSTFFTFAIPASAEILSSDTVVVSASLAGENGALEEVAIGDKSYTVTVGTNAFKTVSAALDAVPAGGTILLAAGVYSEGVKIGRAHV